VTRITLDGGVKVRTFSPPPPGFHPLTASAAELTKHGFPARPDRPQHLERYGRLFDQIKNRFHYIEPTFQVNTKRRHGLAPKRDVVVQAGNENNLIWSGGLAFAPPGESFRWIVGQWMVPNVNAPTENQDYYSAVWIGIDGDGSPQSLDVCQVGINCDVSRSGTSVSRSFYPWWEWYQESADTGEVQITNLAVGPGDTVSVVICTAGAGATEATVFFANLTSGVGTSFVMEAQPGVNLVGNSAEWVVERPTVDGQISMLADYGEVFFSGCDAVSYLPDGSSSEVVGGGTEVYIDMVAFNTNILSHGILIAPTVVQCVYIGSE
jgi:hypothetical protein